MRTRPHHHACQHCGQKTECGGTWEQNYDGIPEVICREFHLDDGSINADFLCDDCTIQQVISVCEDCNAWGTEPHDATCDLVGVKT